MVIVIFFLSVAAAVLLFLYLAKCRNIRNLTSAIRSIPRGGSNELLHTSGGDRSLQELIGEINAILRELRQTKVRYRKKSHEMEQMMTNISHDLRTPLTSALGYIGMLQNGELSEEERARELAVVEKRLLRLEELIDAFFEFSGIISGGKAPDKEPLNLVGVLEEAAGHYYDDYSAKNRAVHLSASDVKIMIHSNARMLMRVFDNLIGNAYQHGTGDLYITAEMGERMVIRFANAMDDPALEIDRVFDEFYTMDISRTKGHTGLGLAIARQFVELLGGEIAAVYEKGIFTITVVL